MKKRNLIIVVAVTMLLIVVIALFGLGEYVGGEYKVICGFKSSHASVVLYEEYMGDYIAVVNDDNASLMLIDKSGNLTLKQDLDFDVIKAEIKYNKAYLYWEDKESENLALTCVSLIDFTVEEEIVYSLKANDVLLFSADKDCNMLYVPVEENTLYKLSRDSVQLERFRLSDTPQFLHGSDSEVIMYAEESVFIFESESLSTFIKHPTAFVPYKKLDNYYVTIDGELITIDNRGVDVKFRCEIAPTADCFYSARNTMLAYLVDLGGICVVDMHTNDSRTYHVEGTVKAVSTENALVVRENELFFTTFESFKKQEISEPDDNNSSDIEDELPDELDLYNGFIYVPYGTTVSSLKKMFDDAPTVYNSNGAIAASGAVKTGMSVKGYEIVILGDCNGTGTLNSSDVKEAQAMFLGTCQRSEVYFAAADMNFDGAITTSDLALIAREVEKY